MGLSGPVGGVPVSPERPRGEVSTRQDGSAPGRLQGLTAASAPPIPRPLAGVRVIDLTVAVAGPIATQLLGGLGAEVIRIETPWGRPKAPMLVAPPLAEARDEPWNRIRLFNELHHSKRSLSLNLLHPLGKQTLLDLVGVSDVLVENFSPRVMGNFGLEWETLRERNPDLVFASMPAFGKSGPYRDRVSYGPGIDAMSGLAWLTGYADETPLKPGNFYCDQNAGLHTAYAVVAALLQRDHGGAGQTVELAMIEGELQLVADALLSAQFMEAEPERIGNDHRCWAPHGVYAGDGDDAWLALACRCDADWAALLRVIAEDTGDDGGVDLATALRADPRFRTNLRRWKHRRDLNALIGKWSALHQPEILAQRLQAAGVPASNVVGARDLLHDQHFLERQTAVLVEHPQIGPTPVPQPAFRLQRTPSPPTGAAPLFADGTDYVLRDLLGYADAQIDELIDAGVTSHELLERPT